MSSFSTAGGSAKAATTLLPGRSGQHIDEGANLANKTASIRVEVSSGPATSVIDVTGSGVLAFSYLCGIFASTSNNVTMTIDGTVVLNDTQNRDIGSNQLGMSQVGSIYWRTLSTGINVAYQEVPFNKSLLVTVQSDSTVYYYYNYYLT